jgi:hypothetical protein
VTTVVATDEDYANCTLVAYIISELVQQQVGFVSPSAHCIIFAMYGLKRQLDDADAAAKMTVEHSRTFKATECSLNRFLYFLLHFFFLWSPYVCF